MPQRPLTLPVLFFRPWSVLLLLALFGLAWGWHLHSVAFTIPLDNLEQLVWSQSIELGYYKHPPLPTWLLAAVGLIVPTSEVTTELLGASLTVASLFLLWRLLRQIRGKSFATVCLLAALCVSFYNGRVTHYNHNTVLMFWVICTATLWWQVIVRPRMLWWFLIGVCAAGGMLSKYQFAVVVVPILFTLFRFELWRSAQNRIGIVLALVVSLVLFAPHFIWLVNTPVTPLQYATEVAFNGAQASSKGRLWSIQWLADFLFNRCLPGLMLLAVALLMPGREAKLSRPRDQADHFLFAWGFGPIVSMVLLGLITGADLQLQWGTAFALLFIPAAAALMQPRAPFAMSAARWGTVSMVFIAIQALAMGYSLRTSAFGWAPASPAHWRQMPSEQIAMQLDASVRKELNTSISLVAGPAIMTTGIGTKLPAKPKLLLDNNLDFSPWVKCQDWKNSGAIELFAPGLAPADAIRIVSGWAWKPYANSPKDKAQRCSGTSDSNQK
jgi:4-amino-4-deoxy-L-arabinose transferase-like glycosyltransferase